MIEVRARCIDLACTVGLETHYPLQVACSTVYVVSWEARARAARVQTAAAKTFLVVVVVVVVECAHQLRITSGRLPLPLIGGSISCSTSCSCDFSLSLTHAPSFPDPARPRARCARGVSGPLPVHVQREYRSYTGPDAGPPPDLQDVVFSHDAERTPNAPAAPRAPPATRAPPAPLCQRLTLYVSKSD